MGLPEVEARSALPPPYLLGEEGRGTSLELYSYTTTPSESSPSYSHHQTITVLQFRDSSSRRPMYSASIPKKREGWKAEVSFVSEKERAQLRCEVRREPLARKYDFRDAQFNHNVMIPSTSLSSKSFSIEAPDGQRLMWKRSATGWSLVSMPSQTLLAQYSGMIKYTAGEVGQVEHAIGRLDIQMLPTTTEPTFTRLHRNQPSTSSMVSDTSSTSSSEGPRLGRANQRLSVGLCAPGTIGAAIASPQAAAGMNRYGEIGDELSNLGRTSIKIASKPRQQDDSQEYTASRDRWLALNQSTSTYKNNDPRPRNVDTDLVVSSLVAVLAG